MQIGERIDQHEIVAELGRGGMATVYRARQLTLGRFEALKVPDLAGVHITIGTEGDYNKRFIVGAKIAANLHHDHIATVYTVSAQGSAQPYFTMELIEGGDLKDLLEARGRLSLDETLQILGPVASALDYAHSQHVVHRDIKPDNLMFKPTAEGWNPQVVDFGIAHAAEPEGAAERTRMTQAGLVIGAPAYMSPEQAHGSPDIDYRSDIYSLGIVAYEMLCGRTPFRAENDNTSALGILMKHAGEAPPPPRSLQPDIPQSVNDALLRALAKDPEDRFQSCSEFVEALRPRPQGPPPPWPKVVAGSVLALGAAILVVAALAKRTPTPTVSPAPTPTSVSTGGYGGDQRPPTSTPTVAPGVSEAANLVSQADPLIDGAVATTLSLTGKVVAGHPTLAQMSQATDAKTKLVKASKLDRRATKLDPHNEDAQYGLCRALLYLDACETTQQLKKASVKFPHSNKFDSLRVLAVQQIGANCK